MEQCRGRIKTTLYVNKKKRGLKVRNVKFQTDFLDLETDFWHGSTMNSTDSLPTSPVKLVKTIFKNHNNHL